MTHSPATETGTASIYDEISIVITSCRRQGLLRQTIDSMRPWVDRFSHKFIIEDSAEDVPLFDELRAQGWVVVVNGEQLGQHISLDRVYGMVKTRFVFHCEEDWGFSNEPNFSAAVQILEHGIGNVSKVSIVSCRRWDDRNEHAAKFFQQPFIDAQCNGDQFCYAKYPKKLKWNAFGLNPNVQKISLWKEHGPWADFRTEGSIARYLQKRNYNAIRPLPGSCAHIGDDQHVTRIHRRKTFMGMLRQWIRRGV